MGSRSKHRLAFRCWIAATALLLSVGCASEATPKTFPVRGMVRLADGSVLREGIIEMEPRSATDLVTARGKIGADGIFELSTFTNNDGAMPGVHRVIVISNYQIGSGAERPGEIPRPKFNPKYCDFGTTDLEVEVKREANEVIIELE